MVPCGQTCLGRFLVKEFTLPVANKFMQVQCGEQHLREIGTWAVIRLSTGGEAVAEVTLPKQWGSLSAV